MPEFEVVRFLANIIVILNYLDSNAVHNVCLRPSKFFVKKVTPYKIRISLNVQLASIDKDNEANNLYFSPEIFSSPQAIIRNDK